MEYVTIIEYKSASGPDDIPKIARVREFVDSHAIAKTEEAIAGLMKGS